MRLIDADKLRINCVCVDRICVDGRTIENAPTVKAIPIEKLLKNMTVKLNEIEQLTPTWLSQLELGMLEKCDIDFAEGYKRALSDIIDIIKRYDHEKDI